MKHQRLILLTFIFLFAACTTVPLTNRRQVTGVYSSEDIIQMSSAAYKQVMDSVPLSSNEAEVAQIKRVGTKIKAAVEQYLNN